MFLYILLGITAFFVVRWLLRKLSVGNYGDKFVFITGCDTGFGNLLAKRLDNLGFHVFAGCLTESVKTELQAATSRRLDTVSLDVTKETSVAKAVEEITRQLPKDKGLWAVVNNAGIAGGVGAVDWLTRHDYDVTMAVNLYGVISVTTACLPLVRKATGRIVNMSSIAGRFTIVAAPYAVSKFGVEAFSDTLRHEMYISGSGVTVHILEPGCFKTGIFQDSDHWRDVVEDKRNRAPQNVRCSYDDKSIDRNTHLCIVYYYLTMRAVWKEVPVKVTDLEKLGKRVLPQDTTERLVGIVLEEQLLNNCGLLSVVCSRIKVTKQIKKLFLDTASPDIYKVVDAYNHAITARFPKARYVVGTDANIVYRLLWSVPEWLSDYIVYRLSKVD